MSRKMWSYNQITEAAKRRIAKLKELHDKANDPDLQSFYRASAWGVLGCWDTLTTGWQRTGDSQRMDALCDLKSWIR